MKPHTIGLAAALFLTPLATALEFDQVDIESWYGSGENEALLIMDWTDGRQVAFGYRWGLLETATGLDMLEAVVTDESRLHREWVDGMELEAVFGLGWDADNDGFSFSDPDDWYEEGWFEDGFWGYYIASDGTDWDFSFDGIADRTLTDGDWDGFAWAPDFDGSVPVVPLVPAPSAALLLLLSGLHYNRRR